MHKKSRIRVSVAGASGYAGGELLRYLVGHPAAHLQMALAHSQSGQPVEALYPNLRGFVSQTLEKADWAELGSKNDLVFLSLPHGTSQEPVKALLTAGCKVVDLGADFRLDSADTYAETYGAPHSAPELLDDAVYGLPELNRDKIKGAKLVANPGCYPTASILGLLPLREHLNSPPVIDAKSGVSGAGRSLKLGSLYGEVNENFQAYAVGCHRHTPEIGEKIGQPVIFTPHLVPMTRGILATIYVDVAVERALPLFEQFYNSEPFVDFMTEGLPNTKSVAGTNFCRIAVKSSGIAGRSIVISVIDNLGKGAAGTAIHNMNLMFGLPEHSGLMQPALLP